MQLLTPPRKKRWDAHVRKLYASRCTASAFHQVRNVGVIVGVRGAKTFLNLKKISQLQKLLSRMVACVTAVFLKSVATVRSHNARKDIANVLTLEWGALRPVNAKDV